MGEVCWESNILELDKESVARDVCLVGKGILCLKQRHETEIIALGIKFSSYTLVGAYFKATLKEGSNISYI